MKCFWDSVIEPRLNRESDLRPKPAVRLIFKMIHDIVRPYSHSTKIWGDMISKIYNIRGIGRFKDFESRQGVDLGRLTLIYSENGQGKSTFADILRSLSEGDGARLLGRKTVGALNQFVKLEMNESTVCFHNERWNLSFNDIVIFDEVFINDNVYEGLKVSAAHREKLHPIIVGEAQKHGVQKVEQLVAERDATTERRTQVKKRIESALAAMSIQPEYKISFDQFIKLTAVEDLGSRIASSKNIVEQQRASDKIQRANSFRSISAITLPVDDLQKLLQKKLSGIADDAREVLQAHVDRFSGNEMKSWLRQGSQYIDKRESEANDVCPYCGQSLAGLSLIKHYQAIFEETYEAFETQVSDFSFQRLDFSSWLADANAAYESNLSLTTFWESHLPALKVPALKVPDLDLELVEESLSNAVSEMKALLKIKQNALFKEIEISPKLEKALDRLRGVLQEIDGYNAAIRRLNESIDELRNETASGNLEIAENELAKLKYTQLRYSTEVAPECECFLNLGRHWTELDKEINRQRNINAQAIKNTFKQYGESLNKHLEVFGASFRVNDLTQTQHGGVFRAGYKIGLSGESVDLGQSKHDISKRSFRNVLSEGDKRTLALAFFLSQLDQLNNLNGKVIVFDDPVTSMDDSRRNNTILEIGRLAKRSKQVFVLSHRPEFLHSIWYKFCRHGDGKIGSTQLEIRCARDSSVLTSWNMEATVASLHAKRIKRILEYYNDESDRDEDEISGELRPLLEYHYKIHYPELFEQFNINTIGDLVRILDLNSSSPVVKALAAKDKDTLAGLNIVHRETMHGQEPPPMPLTRNELKSDCATVLKLLGRRAI